MDCESILMNGKRDKDRFSIHGVFMKEYIDSVIRPLNLREFN